MIFKRFFDKQSHEKAKVTHEALIGIAALFPLTTSTAVPSCLRFTSANIYLTSDVDVFRSPLFFTESHRCHQSLIRRYRARVHLLHRAEIIRTDRKSKKRACLVACQDKNDGYASPRVPTFRDVAIHILLTCAGSRQVGIAASLCGFP